MPCLVLWRLVADTTCFCFYLWYLKAKTIDLGNLLADVEFNNRFTGIPGQRAEGGVTGPYESHSGGSGGGAEGGWPNPVVEDPLRGGGMSRGAGGGLARTGNGTGPVARAAPVKMGIPSKENKPNNGFLEEDCKPAARHSAAPTQQHFQSSGPSIVGNVAKREPPNDWYFEYGHGQDEYGSDGTTGSLTDDKISSMLSQPRSFHAKERAYDMEWERIKEAQKEIAGMITSLQGVASLTSSLAMNPENSSGTMGGWGVGSGPPMMQRRGSWDGGRGPPSTSVGGVSKDKNAVRREKARIKREEKEAQEQRRLAQEEAQVQGAKDLTSMVKKREQRLARLSNKKGKGPATVQRAARVDEWKVKRHVLVVNEPVKVLFKFGTKGEEKWVTLDEIWEPANITTLVPAWRCYCQDQGLPDGWGSGASLAEEGGGGLAVGGDVPADDKSVAGAVAAKTNGEEEDLEPAVCIGHCLDNRGLVYMKLHWKDGIDKETGRPVEDSWHQVKGIMGINKERKAYGRTWIAYCNSWGMVDDQFRMMGVAVVEKIEGHEWADCGHPVARIRWGHGEVAVVPVKNAMEPRGGDGNGFKAAWEAYCSGIDGADEAFRKGCMDGSRKKNKGKRPRRNN